MSLLTSAATRKNEITKAASIRIPHSAIHDQLGTPHSALRTGFTLLELLVVITIIGILAAIGLPAIRGMNKSNSMVAADRQLVDDINFARRLAIANHTTIYVVFIPPWIVSATLSMPVMNDTNLARMMTNLYQGQFTTYALFSYRSVGDQPGQQSPHYWTPWRTLPNGIYIATNKFVNPYEAAADGKPYAPGFFTNSFPVPIVTNTAVNVLLPYIAFNYLGQLIYKDQSGNEDLVVQSQPTQNSSTNVYYEYIPLAHGSILYNFDQNNNLTPGYPDIVETPAGNAYYENYWTTNAAGGVPLPVSPVNESDKVYNQIYVDPLTGKARVQRQEVQ